MSRVPGYAITVKLFIPAPKSDFKTQAAAANIVAAIVTDKVLTAELVATAKVISADGRFTSMEQEAPAVEQANTQTETGDEPGSETQSDETAVEGVRKAGRSRG